MLQRLAVEKAEREAKKYITTGETQERITTILKQIETQKQSVQQSLQISPTLVADEQSLRAHLASVGLLINALIEIQTKHVHELPIYEQRQTKMVMTIQNASST